MWASNMELWDLYTPQRVPVGKTHLRGQPIPDGLCHLVVHVWIRNSKGQYLISQRSSSRPAWPLMWESVGGSVLTGEDSLTGALREVREEVGLDLSPEQGRLVFSEAQRLFRGKKSPDILDVWLFDYDGGVALSNALTDEVAQVKWMTPQEIKALDDAGQLVETLRYFFEGFQEQIMTTVYFIRHAQPNTGNHDDRSRELTSKGLKDREQITNYLQNTPVDAILSSPYKRAVDTVRHLADSRNLPVELVDAFRERKVADTWIEDFQSYARRQWEDFDYALPGGESLREVQARNIAALQNILATRQGQTLVIGGHGTAISTVIHHYHPSFGFSDFEAIQPLMPLIVKFTFDGVHCVDIQKTSFAIC